MKVLYHHRTQAEDAQGIHIQEMVQAFQQLGHSVDIVALVQHRHLGAKKTSFSPWAMLRRYAPNWLYEIMGLAYNIVGYRQLTNRIEALRPDLIYERYSLNTFCGIWAARRCGIPVILEVNAPLYYEQNQLGDLSFKSLARFSERWICSNSTRTAVVSEVMRKYLVGEGVPAEHIFVLYNGINPAEFNPSVSGSAIRQKYGLDGKLVVGFVGWFRKWHGLEMLLEIAREKSFAELGVKVLLVGEGPAYADLYAYASAKELKDTVIFAGAVGRQEIPSYIAAMDIAVQPSSTAYACPMKLLEYMGMGKCIVAPAQENIKELCKDGDNAFLFEAGSKDSMKSSIMRAVSDPDARNCMGKRAFQTLLDRGLIWEHNARRVLQAAGFNCGTRQN
jgi:glycosyltransferase involved in cell wall biosynthesis